MTAAIAGFHIFPFGGLRKARNWLCEYPGQAHQPPCAVASASHPNP
jgi:hypothetical protein